MGELSDDQQFLFDSFNNDVVTNEKDDLEISFSDEGKTNVSFTENDRGGTTGTVNLNINQSDFSEKMKDTEDGTFNGDPNYEPSDTEKIATATVHEIGHFREDVVFINNGDSRTKKNKKAVGYENIYRSIIGAKARVGKKHGQQYQKGKRKGQYKKSQQGQLPPTGRD